MPGSAPVSYAAAVSAGVTQPNVFAKCSSNPVGFSKASKEFVPSLSVDAKVFVPTFNADAKEFIMPSFSAGAKEFVPSLSTDAKEFVPSFSTNAAVFVPSFSVTAKEFTPSYEAVVSNQYTPYQQPQAATNFQMFNLDGYSDDSSSEDEAPPLKCPASSTLLEASVIHMPHKRDDARSEGDGTSTPQTSVSRDPCHLDDYSDESSEEDEAPPRSHLSEPHTSAPSESERSDDLSQEEECGKAVDAGELGEPYDADPLHFTIGCLMKERHSVKWFEGFESKLEAKELSEADPLYKIANPPAEPGTTAARKKPSNQHRKPTNHESSRRSQAQASERKPASDAKDFGNLERGEGAKKLAVSDDSFIAQQRARRAANASSESEALSDADVVRTMKGILNKLTVEKFLPLYEKLVNCGIHTVAHLECLVHEVFEKATTQHHFINMYADLCALLHTHFSENPISDDPKITFKKILLNGCQCFFEKHLRPPAILDSLDEEEHVSMIRRYKMQMIGNINFVGALLVRQMLASKVMFAIMEELLTNHTSETLESLACLLTVVGPKFDIEGWHARPLLMDVFNQVKALSRDTSISSRVGFLLRDVTELRATGWKDSKPVKTERPKTLKEIAEQAAKENGDAAPAKSKQRDRVGSNAGKGECQRGGQRRGEYSANSSSSPKKSKGAPAKSDAPASPKAEGYKGIHSLAASKADKSSEACASGSSAQLSPKQAEVLVADFDEEACRKEVSGALKELSISHDVKGAVLRIAAIEVSATRQAAEFCDMLAHIVEEASVARRQLSFELVACLFADGHWKAAALNKGLQLFMEDMYEELKCDVPLLPKVLRDELRPALAGLLASGLLQAEQHGALSA